MKTIKTISIFAICALIATFAFGQKQVEEVQVSAPQFTGIKNVAGIQNEFPNSLIKNYLKEKITYPEEAASCRKEGTEVVEFTVTAEGSVRDFKIVNSVCPMIDEEVLFVLKTTDGMWIPGTKNGQPADMEMELPFTFCVTGNSDESVQEIFIHKATTFFTKGTEMLYEKNNVKKAARYYDLGITYLPYDKSLLLLRGMCRYELGDKEGAVDDWTRLHNLGGTDMNEYMELTQLENMKGYNEMIAILKK
jgi:TonB family protein